ncbi:MAG: hypothetical protein EOP06_16540 [Proteobacteria bacterium]|nr:MAG: hypothetical protein EOP06_16540 [Pseudomonadota bacterium]
MPLMKRFFSTVFTAVLTALIFSGCSESESDPLITNISNEGMRVQETLFVASGTCYGGGVTTSTGSGTVASFELNTGRLRRVIIDYSNFSPGDMPVGIAEYDPKHLLVTVENLSGRRIDLVAKDGSSVSTYLTHSTALNAALRASKLLNDGSLLVSKSTAIEKFSSSKSRVLQGTSPFISAPASVCGTTASLISNFDLLSNGKILFAHSGASPNNKLNLVSSTGYASTADCLATQTAPSALAMPTSVLNHSSGKVFVAYGSSTAAQNSIWSYTVNQTTNAITNPLQTYSNLTYLNGPSAMAEDPASSDIFVANAQSGFNNIERFYIAKDSSLLIRKPISIGPNLYTKCVTAIKVGSEK